MFTRRILSTLKLAHCTHIKNSKIDIIRLPQICLFSSKTLAHSPLSVVEGNTQTEEIKKKKTTPIPKITLLSGNEITVSTFEEAQKLAKRRDLKLVKIVDLDTKTQRPIYRLMTGSEYHEEDLKQRERKKLEKQKSAYKGEKVLIVNQNISEHDLQVHVNKILKWLVKRYEVRMVINGNSENNQKGENVYLFLEKHLSPHGRILQKRQKGSDIKFQVVPPKDKGNEKGDGSGGNPL